MLNGELREVIKLVEYKKVKGQLEKVVNGIEKEFRYWNNEYYQDFLNDFFGNNWNITKYCTIEKKYCKTCFYLIRYYEEVLQ